MAISSARFLEYLCHKWDNLQQAQQWPNQFAHVHYDWWVEGAHLHSRQWYDWNGHVSPIILSLGIAIAIIGFKQFSSQQLAKDREL